MSKKKMVPGTLVISLDFELMWGMFDKNQDGSYDANILGVKEAIPKLLQLFTQYDIHATWATVGMLMAKNTSELNLFLPDTKPEYLDTKYSAYEHYKNSADPDLHFAPEAVVQIIKTEGQELASHTFSHFYCLEEQSSSERSEASFATDCAAQTKIMNHLGVSPKSIVFPRNQWSKRALEVLQQNGITSYRGTENHFIYRARNEVQQTKPLIRALRLLDHYFNISGHHTYTTTAINRSSSDLLNIPASRFLRAYSKKLAILEPLRRRRIKQSMTHAAKHGEVFHLWWHPHNFGVNQKQNFRNLTKLLRHYRKLQQKYGMKSLNMEEVTRVSEQTA